MAFTEGVHYWEVICPITCNTIRKSITPYVRKSPGFSESLAEKAGYFPHYLSQIFLSI